MDTKEPVKKHAGGRPLKYQTVEEIQPLIDKYFADTPEEEWTITGLALALDTSRETLINYEGRGEFFDTIKKAKEMVHNAYEKDLRRKGRSGDIFALKNFGWRDQTQTDVTSDGQPVGVIGIEYVKPSGNKNQTDSDSQTGQGI